MTLTTPKFQSNQSVLYAENVFQIEDIPYYKAQGKLPGWYYDLSRANLKQIHESLLETIPRICTGMKNDD